MNFALPGSSYRAAFTPAIESDDPLANYWLDQATTRLRREIAWMWRESGPGTPGAVGAALDMARFADQKRQFFKTDPTASFLSEKLQQPAPEAVSGAGSFSWAVAELELRPVECFVLALACLSLIDNAAGTIFGTCQNDASRMQPTLALAQRLWHDPIEVLQLADGASRLFRAGLLFLTPSTGGGVWESTLSVPPPVVPTLLFPDCALPPAMSLIQPVADWNFGENGFFVVARLAAVPERKTRVVPLLGPPDAPFRIAAGALGYQLGRDVLAIDRLHEGQMGALLTIAWLRRAVVFVPRAISDYSALSNLDLSITALVAGEDTFPSHLFAGADLMPPIEIPRADYELRWQWWQEELQIPDDRVALKNAVSDCARRFRFERETIAHLSNQLRSLDREPKPDELLAACRQSVQMGELAEIVKPRFKLSELVLPDKQQAQIEEIISAIRNLTRVHHEWGTAHAWNDSGLTALFGGGPGTGKTMAAEVIANELGWPLYRIDLSQVVNKYIGETEKNLRRLFDAADASDVILFFDEADSLFGKRTEVRDAHDRYANLEVSYLLERMERFKGLAILATNRKKDLDEAFMRRLRFVVDFPPPGQAERLRIWSAVIPAPVDRSELDLPFLAAQFPLVGGHIRSAVFHACLQAADRAGEPKLTMADVIGAVKREYEKLDRSTSLDQFGPYAKYLDVPRARKK